MRGVWWLIQWWADCPKWWRYCIPCGLLGISGVMLLFGRLWLFGWVMGGIFLIGASLSGEDRGW